MRIHTLKNPDVTASVEQSRGAPVVAIRDRSTGHQVLLPREREIRFSRVMAPYLVGGFHDCFPSAAPYRYDGGRAPASVPPFGDLWGRFWSIPELEDEITVIAAGKPLPYIFKRRITLAGRRVMFEYEIGNEGRSEFPWLWSGRIFMPVEKDCRIVIPGCESVWIQDEGQRRACTAAWPAAELHDGSKMDLSAPSREGRSVKFFACRVEGNQVAVKYPSSSARVVVHWETDSRRTFGFRLSGGQWPGSFMEPIHFFTVEPATAAYEYLGEAVEAGEAALLGPGESARFSFSIEVQPEDYG